MTWTSLAEALVDYEDERIDRLGLRPVIEQHKVSMPRYGHVPPEPLLPEWPNARYDLKLALARIDDLPKVTKVEIALAGFDPEWPNACPRCRGTGEL